MTRLVPLKRVARVRYGLGQPPPSSDSGIPIIRATNIYRGSIVTDGLVFTRLEDLPLDRAPLLEGGEILVVRSGAYTGDSALVTERWAGSAPGYDLRVTPLTIAPEFLALQLLGRRCLDQIDLVRSRAAQPHLNAEDLGEIEVISLASVDLEQAAVARVKAGLDRLEPVLADLDSMRSVLMELRESMVSSVFEGLLPKTGTTE